MDSVINHLKTTYPQLHFVPGTTFSWSPETTEVIYTEELSQESALWSLLHETAHGLLQHKNYHNDLELLSIEIEAWEEAKRLATTLSMTIDENHIQDCLDTYRDWVYRRSICPTCGTKSIQQGNTPFYRCFNCHTRWKVSDSRFCRAYRITQK